ncbi:hypothetical protein EU538_09155 [Candidatus Thorarchaeota archaeon]|nr:MAG: hypothetical protein EU538_09155 [Candidatus Thorarchaeota archaeon]
MEQLTHQPTSADPNWNESYYFIFYDQSSEIGAMSRVGFKPNRPDGMTFLFVFLPDGRVGAFNVNDEAEHYPDELRVGGMEHRCLNDGRWEYVFEGPLVLVEDPEILPRVRQDPSLIADLVDCKMELRYTAINETYEYSKHMTPESLEIGKKSGDMHWEQIGKVTGELEVGPDIFQISDAMAQRDHTHGIRDWTGVGNWFYFVIWFSDNLALNPAAIILDDGRVSTGGFIFQEGRNIPIKEIEVVKHEYRDEEVFPSLTELLITGADDVEHRLTGRPGRIIPIPFEDADGNQSVLVQSFGHFTFDGREGGYGSYEVLRRI